jgi:hypothetical protein
MSEEETFEIERDSAASAEALMWLVPAAAKDAHERSWTGRPGEAGRYKL